MSDEHVRVSIEGDKIAQNLVPFSAQVSTWKGILKYALATIQNEETRKMHSDLTLDRLTSGTSAYVEELLKQTSDDLQMCAHYAASVRAELSRIKEENKDGD